MNRRAAFLGLGLVAVLAVALLWPYAGDDSLGRPRREGVIRVGYAVEPPYAFLAADGEVTGESPQVAARIAGMLGIARVAWRQVEFGDLLAELEAGRIDLIAAGMFVTPERMRRASFSLPSLHVAPGLLVARGNPRHLADYASASARPDVKFAVLAGAVEEDLLRRVGVGEDRLVRVPDALTGRQAVASGLADALVLSVPTLRWMVGRETPGATELIQAKGPNQDALARAYGQVAFAFRLEDRALGAAWNRALGTYLGSPEHLRLLDSLGFSPAELPRPPRAGGALP
ncbi:MAG: ectoine/hydroxyectoine ABC transporter substrate-binding protein EhuB [Thiobacillus sp.]|nr:ectoine/hydroxyectoine ABC transporter substrate-binding protein EhuB [Thiobacillus sp.]